MKSDHRPFCRKREVPSCETAPSLFLYSSALCSSETPDLAFKVTFLTAKMFLAVGRRIEYSSRQMARNGSQPLAMPAQGTQASFQALPTPGRAVLKLPAPSTGLNIFLPALESSLTPVPLAIALLASLPSGCFLAGTCLCTVSMF